MVFAMAFCLCFLEVFLCFSMLLSMFLCCFGIVICGFLEKNTALSIVFFLQFGHWVEDFKFCSRKNMEKNIENIEKTIETHI